MNQQLNLQSEGHGTIMVNQSSDPNRAYMALKDTYGGTDRSIDKKPVNEPLQMDRPDLEDEDEREVPDHLPHVDTHEEDLNARENAM